MNWKRPAIAGGVVVLVLWLGGAMHYLPRVEDSLREAARASLDAGDAAGAFAGVEVEFSGQEAVLTGRVVSEELRAEAEAIVREQVRPGNGLGKTLNPVIAVDNRVEVLPATGDGVPGPWAVVMRRGERGAVAGHVATGAWKDDLLKEVAGQVPGTRWQSEFFELHRWDQPGWPWRATLHDVPGEALAAADDLTTVVAVTRFDGTWRILGPNADAAEVQAALGRVADGETVGHLLAALREPEGKPVPQPERVVPETAPYLVWALGGDRIDLFGKVRDFADVAKLTDAAKRAFPDRSVEAGGLAVYESIAAVDVDTAALFAQKPSGKIAGGAGWIASWGGQGDKVSFWGPDAFDNEIAQALPGTDVWIDDVSEGLAGFRSGLVQSGALGREQPYVGFISDGKTVSIAGEIADAGEKDAIVQRAETAYAPALAVKDLLRVTPLVESGHFVEDGASLPEFKSGEPGVASWRIGQPSRGGVVHSIYFRTGSSRSVDQQRALVQIRRVLEAYPEARFQIVGHTDNVGPRDSNLQLSEERAGQFVTYLEANGIPADRLSKRGAGPDEPVAPNDDESGRARNRRVDVLLH